MGSFWSASICSTSCGLRKSAASCSVIESGLLLLIALTNPSPGVLVSPPRYQSGVTAWGHRTLLSTRRNVEVVKRCAEAETGARVTFLIRRNGGSWIQPSTTSYDDEAALQAVLEASPDLLPVDEPLALVREFSIPGVGFVDLMGITASGQVVIVECKLRANPQIRREVIGQALSYAGGVWRMSADDFMAEFERRANSPLDDVLRGLGVDDTSSVRRSIAASLELGSFRVVIAVDEITAELRTIVEYLNSHTTGLEIVALELAYSAEADLEILVPQVFGAESAEAKRASAGGSKPNWTVEDMRRTFEHAALAGVAPLALRLLDHGMAHGTKFGGGTGQKVALSCYYALAGNPTSFWALYVGETDARLAFSLGSVNAQSPELAAIYLERLQSLEGFDGLADLGPADLSKYPSLHLSQIGDDSISALLGTFDELRDT